MTTTAEHIGSRIDALSVVRDRQRQIEDLAAERDLAVRQALRSGATITEVAYLLGVDRQTVTRRYGS